MIQDSLHTYFDHLLCAGHFTGQHVLSTELRPTPTLPGRFSNPVLQNKQDQPQSMAIPHCCLLGVLWKGAQAPETGGILRLPLSQPPPLPQTTPLPGGGPLPVAAPRKAPRLGSRWRTGAALCPGGPAKPRCCGGPAAPSFPVLLRPPQLRPHRSLPGREGGREGGSPRQEAVVSITD